MWLQDCTQGTFVSDHPLMTASKTTFLLLVYICQCLGMSNPEIAPYKSPANKTIGVVPSEAKYGMQTTKCLSRTNTLQLVGTA